MAHKDLIRKEKHNQKRGISLAVARVGPEEFTLFDSINNYKLFNLPPDSLILDGYVMVETAGTNAGTVTCGTTEAGSEIFSSADSAVAGKQGTFTGMTGTGTGKTVYAALAKKPSVGVFYIIVEYLEQKKDTGEYTIV